MKNVILLVNYVLYFTTGSSILLDILLNIYDIYGYTLWYGYYGLWYSICNQFIVHKVLRIWDSYTQIIIIYKT